MASIDANKDGLPGLVRAAYLSPASSNGKQRDGKPAPAWEFMEPRAPSQLDVDFLDSSMISRTNSPASEASCTVPTTVIVPS